MKLVELARTVRSKNAGPLTLTLDLMFDDEAHTAAPCNPRARARLRGASMGDPKEPYLEL
jgi:hypothetical protein